MPHKPEHGFTAVDKQDDPYDWVSVLDKLSNRTVLHYLQATRS
jgi:hypothetical protein